MKWQWSIVPLPRSVAVRLPARRVSSRAGGEGMTEMSGRERVLRWADLKSVPLRTILVAVGILVAVWVPRTPSKLFTRASVTSVASANPPAAGPDRRSGTPEFPGERPGVDAEFGP